MMPVAFQGFLKKQMMCVPLEASGLRRSGTFAGEGGDGLGGKEKPRRPVEEKVEPVDGPYELSRCQEGQLLDDMGRVERGKADGGAENSYHPPRKQRAAFFHDKKIAQPRECGNGQRDLREGIKELKVSEGGPGHDETKSSR